MSKVPVCADCEHLMSYLHRKRCTKFCCGHKAINNEISNNYHQIGATIYAMPEYVSRPTIKTSPKWCPLRSGGRNMVKINGIEQLPGQMDMFGGIIGERGK